MTCSLSNDAGLFWTRDTGPDEWEVVTPSGVPNRTVRYFPEWEGESFRYVLDPDGPEARGFGTLADAIQAVSWEV